MKFFCTVLLLLSISACTDLLSTTLGLSDIASAQMDGKWGLYEVGKGWLVNPYLESGHDIGVPYQNIYRVKDSLKTGYYFIGTDGKSDFYVPFLLVQDFYCEYAYFNDGKREGFIDTKGSVVFSKEYFENSKVSDIIINNDFFSYQDSLAYKVYSLIDEKDIYIEDDKYSDFELFTPRVAKVKDEIGYGLISIPSGEYLLDPKFEDIQCIYNITRFPFKYGFKNSLFLAIGNDGKWLYNDKGDVVYPFSIDELLYFINNQSVFKVNGKYGAIDIEGNVIIEPQYSGFYDINVGQDGLFAFFMDGKAGVVNAKNRVVVPFAYENIRVANAKTLLFLENGKWGIMDVNQKVILNPEYDDLGIFPHTKYIIATQGDKKAIMDLDGELLTPFMFDLVGFF